MATAPFVYREAAPGQQAVQYAQLQEQGEADRRRTIAQAYHDMSTQATEMARNNAQMAATRSQMNQRSAEAEKDRALQREGYKSAEAVAAGRTKATEDAWDRRAKAQTDAEAAEVKRQARAFFQAGFSDAAMMNDPKVPQAVKDKISLGRNVRPSPDGLSWVNAHPDPDLPTNVETIPGVDARSSALRRGAAGLTPRPPFSPNTTVTPVPSLGPRPPASTDFRVPTTPGPAPVTPRTSRSLDGWTSKPPPDAVVPRPPFYPNTAVTPVPSPGFTPRETDFSVPVERPGGPAVPAPSQFPSTYDGWLDYNPEPNAMSPRAPLPSLGPRPPASTDFRVPTGQRTMEWRPGIGDGDIPVNLPAIPGSYPGPPENYRAEMGEIPLDERFDEPTYGFTGFDRLNSFGSRITENSSDAIIRRFVQAKKSNPNIKLIKRGGGIDQLSGRQIPEQYFIQPTPRTRMTVVPQQEILDANPRMTVVPQQEILDANPEMLQTYDPPVRRMQVIRQSDILGVPRGYSPTWDTPGRRLPGTFSPY